MKPEQTNLEYYRRPADPLLVWLAIATHKLVPSAQARIRTEIEAHYAEAVQHHIEGGRCEPEARSATLAELGDAEKAAKRFQEKHLTLADAKEIRKMMTPGKLLNSLIFHGLLIPFAFLMLACVNKVDVSAWFFVGALLMYAAVGIVLGVCNVELVRKSAGAASLNQFFLNRLIRHLGVCALWLIWMLVAYWEFLHANTNDFQHSLLMLLLWVCIFVSSVQDTKSFLALRKKVQTDGNNWDPPKGGPLFI